MGIMTDYLKWRGDLTFSQTPFCEADNLILSCLSYVKLDGIVSDDSECITIKEASNQFFRLHSAKELKEDHSFVRSAPFLLKDMAGTIRFQNLLLRHYENLIDTEKELQFCALEILMEDGSSFVSFRGTDDTIVGWKEDFNMSFGKVPAEDASVRYLNQIGHFGQRPLRVGGHSKGGHLAVYAASLCDFSVQDRILAVYSNDGPGFYDLFCETPGYKKIQPRIHKYVPEFSIFGMLLYDTEDPIFIKSRSKGVMQHDAFSWEIEGPSFLRGEKHSFLAQVFTDSVQDWLKEMNAQQRKAFIDDLFSLLETTGAQTIQELHESGLKSLTSIAKELDTIDPKTREKLDSLLRIFLSQWGDSIRSTRFSISGKTE